MATDPSFDGDESISSRSRNLTRRLHDLIGLLEEREAADKAVVSSDQVSDILDRFMLWCGNLGALHQPTKKISLDQRLSDAPEVRDQILINIADFNEAIEDLSSIILGDNPNREIPSSDDGYDDQSNDDSGLGLNDGEGQDLGTSDPPMDEAHMNLELMAEAMKSLFQLAVLVRKSGPRDRFQKALQQSTFTFPEFFDINYVEQKYSKLYNDENRWLSNRLGSASAKRRQFIKYCREHKARLDAHDDETLVVRDGATEKLSSKATTFVHNIESRSLEAPSGDEDDAISIMTATTTFNSDTKLKLPSLSELSPEGDHFECPICFTLQSIDTEKAWKIHAFRDLKAYVCTVGGTECNSLFFGDRNTWFEHELQSHRSRYNCTFCDREFRSKSSIMAHFSSVHGSFPQDQLSALAKASCVAPSQFRARDCPFCDDWSIILEQRANPKGKRVDTGTTQDVFVPAAKFKRHVATHQEQLAIFVVPRSSDPDADTDENIGSDNLDAASLTDISNNSTEEAVEVEADVLDKATDMKVGESRQMEKGDRLNSEAPGVTDKDSSHLISKDLQKARDEQEFDVLFLTTGDWTVKLPKNRISGKDGGSLSVGELKDRIAVYPRNYEAYGHSIKLMHRGRYLNDMEKQVREYGIKHLDKIDVILESSLSSVSRDESDRVNIEVKVTPEPLTAGEVDSNNPDAVRTNPEEQGESSASMTPEKEERSDKETMGRTMFAAQEPPPSTDSSADEKTPRYPPRTTTPEPAPPEWTRSHALQQLRAIHQDFVDKFLPWGVLPPVNPPKDPKQRLSGKSREGERAMQDMLRKADEIDTRGDPVVKNEKKRVMDVLLNALNDVEAYAYIRD